MYSTNLIKHQLHDKQASPEQEFVIDNENNNDNDDNEQLQNTRPLTPLRSTAPVVYGVQQAGESIRIY